MKAKNYPVSVKKILNAINACQNEQQIEECKVLIKNYVKSANKVENVNDLQVRLDEELLQRQEALYLVKIFNI
jgi:hypothetical protein